MQGVCLVTAASAVEVGERRKRGRKRQLAEVHLATAAPALQAPSHIRALRPIRSWNLVCGICGWKQWKLQNLKMKVIWPKAWQFFKQSLNYCFFLQEAEVLYTVPVTANPQHTTVENQNIFYKIEVPLAAPITIAHCLAFLLKHWEPRILLRGIDWKPESYSTPAKYFLQNFGDRVIIFFSSFNFSYLSQS